LFRSIFAEFVSEQKGIMSTIRSVQHRVRAILIPPGIVFCTFLIGGGVAAADSLIVGNGTPASCTEQALRNALDIASHDGGDDLRFACGVDPVTIVFDVASATDGGPDPVTMSAPNHTAIDGGGLITLMREPSVTQRVPLFLVGVDTTFALRGLAVQVPTWGQGVLNRGRLSVDDVTFTILHASAIENWASLTVRNCTFLERGAFGFERRISNYGKATIDHSAFVSRVGSGGIVNTGTLQVRNSTFSGNDSETAGGAIENAREGVLVLDNCEFFGNGARRGGAIENDGHALIKNCDFLKNSAFFFGGGAIYNGGSLEIKDTTFSGNSAFDIGLGGALFNAGALTVTNSLITSNVAGVLGGGIYMTDTASLTLRHTHVINNTPNDIWPIQ
jgi:predicted outer membrane repeat protein